MKLISFNFAHQHQVNLEKKETAVQAMLRLNPKQVQSEVHINDSIDKTTSTTTAQVDTNLNFPRRTLIDRSAVVYGQTPHGIREKQLEQMAVEMNTDLETFCNKILALSDHQQFEFLRSYYEKSNSIFGKFFQEFHNYEVDSVKVPEKNTPSRRPKISHKVTGTVSKVERSRKKCSSTDPGLEINKLGQHTVEHLGSAATTQSPVKIQCCGTPGHPRRMTDKGRSGFCLADSDKRLDGSQNIKNNDADEQLDGQAMTNLRDDGSSQETGMILDRTYADGCVLNREKRNECKHFKQEMPTSSNPRKEYKSVITSILFDNERSELKKTIRKQSKPKISPSKRNTVLETLLFE